MDIRDVLTMLRRRWAGIVAVTLIGLAIAALVTLNYKPTYAVSSTIFVRVTPAGTEPDDLSNAATLETNEVTRLASLASTTAMLQRAIDRLPLPGTSPSTLSKAVHADLSATDELELTVTGEDRNLSVRLVQEISNELVANVAARSPKNEAGAPIVVASIARPATIDNEPVADNANLILLVGALVGLAVGVMLAALRHALDLTVRTRGDVARATRCEVVTEAPRDSRLAKGRVGVLDDLHSPLAEAHRRLRTHLLFGATAPTRVLVVTSAIAREGKSTTSIGIASALANAGQSVLLIDADLRTPHLAGYLGLQPTAGLTTVLSSETTLAQAVQRVGPQELDVLTAGGTPANPAELLGSQNMKELLDEAVANYDFVILDAPAVLPVTDATLLAALSRGVIMVAGSGTVTAPQLRDAIAALERINGSILGIVLNKVRRTRRDRMTLSPNPHDRHGTAEAATATNVPAHNQGPARAIAPGDALADR